MPLVHGLGQGKGDASTHPDHCCLLDAEMQTKKIHGLHENDFIMAAKIDRIFARTATA
jgi:pterin-4a-carbinolamine dehydratase